MAKLHSSHFQGQELALGLSLSLGKNDFAGFIAPAIVQSNRTPEDKQAMEILAEAIMQDSQMMGRFCDRIYDLLRDDLKYQQERNYGCGRRY